MNADRRTLPPDFEPGLVVRPAELAGLDPSPSAMADVPVNRMFEIRNALAVYARDFPGGEKFDASQGDGGASLPAFRPRFTRRLTGSRSSTAAPTTSRSAAPPSADPWSRIIGSSIPDRLGDRKTSSPSKAGGTACSRLMRRRFFWAAGGEGIS